VRLRHVIEQEIRDRGPMPFSRYMELCLYHPEFGYYARPVEQFGKAGDFYTSSDVHAVFGRLLARQFQEMWRMLDSPGQVEVVELGPGRGLFAQDVLDWSQKKFPDFFSALHYTLVETSSVLRQRIESTLGGHVAAGKATVIPPEVFESRRVSSSVPTIIFANELFDALPVEIFSDAGELYLDLSEGRIREVWRSPSQDALDYLDRYSVSPTPGGRLEVGLAGQQYAARVAQCLGRGFVVIVDYGYVRQEQVAGRHRGTLMTYRHHSAGSNPYASPGEQDITAHVNFTALADAFESQGLHVSPLVTQSQFLLGIGEENQFADAFEDCKLPQEHAKVALQLKHLVTPAGMGEVFHVLVAAKGLGAKKISSLRGLSFGRDSAPVAG